MKFVYNDGGRSNAGYKEGTRDCVVRAIAIATGKSYKDVYNDLHVLMMHSKKEIKKAMMRVRKNTPSPKIGVSREIYDSYLKYYGWKWIPTMGIGTGCKVHLRDNELPLGKLIVRLSKHLTAVIDRTIHDTSDCSRYGTRCVYGYYIK